MQPLCSSLEGLGHNYVYIWVLSNDERSQSRRTATLTFCKSHSLKLEVASNRLLLLKGFCTSVEGTEQVAPSVETYQECVH